MRTLCLAATLSLLLLSCEGGPPPAAGSEPATFQPSEEPPRPAGMTAPERFTNARTFTLRTDAERLAGMGGVELWYSLDDGDSWVNNGFFNGEPPEVSFAAPRDGRYLFALVPVDRAGEREFTPRAGVDPDYRVVVDTAPPAVVLLAPNGGERFGARRATTISWRAEDPNLGSNAIAISVSADGGGTWIPVESGLPNSGRYAWETPAASAPSYRVRVTATDLAGNAAEGDSAGSFVVDGLAPEVRLHGPLSSTRVPVPVTYSTIDVGGAGAVRATLWITDDGGASWRRYQDQDGGAPFLVEAVDGTYGLWIVAEDRVGNRGEAPHSGSAPQAPLLIDTSDPQVVVDQPRPGVYQGGTDLTIQWAARDERLTANPIRLEYTLDGRVWTTIADGLENAGVHRWTLPRSGTAAARVRVTAADVLGRTGSAVSEPFSIDVLVPEAVAISPTRSTSTTVEIPYEVRNRGAANVEHVHLWYRPEGAREWIDYGEDPDRASPFLFTHSDGTFDVFVTCSTLPGIESGLRQADPAAGTAAQLTLTVDSRPPRFAFRTFHDGAVFRAGGRADIVWDFADDHPDAQGLSLWHSPDGGRTWNPVAQSVDPTAGRFEWILPEISGATHLLKAECRDGFGLEMTPVTTERPFRIDVQPPRVRLLEVPEGSVRSRRLRVEFAAGDEESGIQEVEGWTRPADMSGSFERVTAVASASGEMFVEVPRDGAWDVLVTARDGVGRRSADPMAARGDFRVTVDTTPPRVEVLQRVDATGRPLFVNESYEIEWTATDEMTASGRIGVRIEYTTDGGRTWLVAVARMPNEGRARADSFLRPGAPARLRVVAMDEAGNEGFSETAEFDIQVVPPPRILLGGLVEGEVVDVESSRELTWSVERGPVHDGVLEMRSEASATWAPVSPVREVFDFTPPSEAGVYFVRLRALDRFERSVASPEVRFVVRYPTEAVLTMRLDPEPQAGGGEFRAGQPVLFRWVVDRGGIVSQTIQVRPPGQEWTSVANPAPAERGGTYETRELLGAYALRIVAMDRFGRQILSNELEFVVGAPPLPGIVLESVPATLDHPAGTMVSLHWQFQGGELQNPKLERQVGGEWRIERMLDQGDVAFRLPPTEGETILHVSATDPQGRTVYSDDLRLRTMVPPTPTISFIAVIHEGEEMAPGAMSMLSWQASDPRLVESVAVQIRRGEEWETVATSTEEIVSFEIPREAGEYALRLRGVDVLNREAVSANAVRFRVRSYRVTVESSMRPERAQPGDPVVVTYRLPGEYEGVGDVRVEMAAVGSPEWIPVDAVRDPQGLRFDAPPTPGTYHVRAVFDAGATTGVSPAMALEVEGPAEPPAPAPEGPFLRLTNFRDGGTYVGGRWLPIWFDRSEDVAVADIRVEVSAEAGGEESWQAVAEEDLRRLDRWIQWRLPPAAGNRYRVRVSWTAPDGRVVSDDSPVDFAIEAPQPEGGPMAGLDVRLLDDIPQAIRGGTTMTLHWMARPQDAKVDVDLWVGGERQAVVAERMDAAGQVEWTVPRIDGAECEIRLVVRCEGEEKTVPSRRFAIRSTAPRVRPGARIED